MKKLLLMVIAILTLSCCDNDSQQQTEKTALNLVTGITFRQNFDDAPLQLGNPNVFIDDKFVIYPNPAINMFVLWAQNNEDITDVWIVPASPERIYQDESFDNILVPNLYEQEVIESNSNISLTGQSSSSLTVNIENLEIGYYRVFVKINGEIYWDNLYKSEDGGNTGEEINAIIDFWN